jgi:uncharacterized SAM-binding protein YcdF (DUF218 family)
MFYFLSKLIPLFLYPVGMATLLLVAALVLRRHARWRTGCIVAALLVLWLGGNRFVAMISAGALESQYPTLPAGTTAELIVVLGGATREKSVPRPTHEVNEAGDRLIYAARLWKEGGAPRILVSGGGALYLGPTIESEAVAMADTLVAMGVAQDAILLEDESLNTLENARFTREILASEGITSPVILVTSAMHMPRSAAIFDKLGIPFVPAPTDFLVTEADWAFYTQPTLEVQAFNLVPSADDLRLTSLAMREWIGLVVYRLRGWA